jgi:hypothetical protein
MRNTILAATVLSLAGLGAFAADSKGFSFLSAAEAERTLASTDSLQTTAAMWVWTDQIAYQPGQPLTLRWTLRPNNDNYPYTIVAYRQNNQTGVKQYVSTAGASATAVDIFGNSVAQGFRITRLPEANKQVLIGAGGFLISSTLAVPNEPGMHTIVVQLRDYTGQRVVKTAYWKFGVYSEVVTVTGSIRSNTTWTNDRLYRLNGIVLVEDNAVLTIQPGTIVQGNPGSQPPSALVITNEGRINASGTRSRPIIMTSTRPIGQRNRGDWGGLLMLGRAPLNDPAGSLNIEGLPDVPETRYGGTDAAHNCGTLRYVRVEFAGSLLRPNEETNSFTWGSCGTQTVSSHLQAHYGLDDSFEWFGGTNDAKYLVGTYGADDYIDYQIGWRGRIQHGVFLANEDRSNRGIEADNYERGFANTPVSQGQMYNLTFVGGGTQGFDEADATCLYFRRGAAGLTFNTTCFHWVTRGFGGADFASIEPRIADASFNANGIVLWDNGFNTSPATPNTIDGQVTAAFRPFAQVEARQFLLTNPLMRRPLEYSDPDFRPLIGSPLWRATWVQPPDDGFFDQWATWAGAFGDENWTEEWTTFHQEQDLQP